MESLISLLSDLSGVIGVPAALCLAWAAFVIRDHEKRIKQLEDALEASDGKHAEELNKIYDRINDMAGDVNFIKGLMASASTAGGIPVFTAGPPNGTPIMPRGNRASSK